MAPTKDVQHLMLLPYMRMIRSHLRVIGLCIDKTRSTKCWRLLLSMMLTMCFILSIVYMTQNFDKLSWFDRGQLSISCCLYIVDLLIIFMPSTKAYGEILEEFINRIHQYHYKNKSAYAKKIYHQINMICKYLAYTCLGQVYFGLMLLNGIPLYLNYDHGLFFSNSTSNRNFAYSLDYAFPFAPDNIYRYIFLAIINCPISYFCALVFCITSCLLNVLVLHAYGHLKILKYNLENIPRPAGLRYDEKEMVDILRNLKENIKHHIMIKTFMSKFSDAFGLLVFVYHGFYYICGCILILLVSKQEFLHSVKYIPITVFTVLLLVQTSIIFEQVASKSDVLPNSVYGMPWECMDRKGRFLVLIFLQNVQTPITVKALGIVRVGINTMVAILKSSYSYYVILRSFVNNE